MRVIRSWDGSQDRAFEELCYQLRDPVPSGATLTKLGNPDAGYEWFVRHRNGVEWGWQAKFSPDIGSLLKGMEASLKTVVVKRPRCRKLTFCIPIDLPDSPAPGQRKSARQKFDDWKVAVRERVPAARRVTIELWQEGDLLERLAQPEHRGRAWFFWGHEVFSPDWCAARMRVTKNAAGTRYAPELNVELPVAFALEGLGRSDAFADRYRQRRGEFVKAARRVTAARFAGLGVTLQLRELERSIRHAVEQLPASPPDGDAFPRAALAAAVEPSAELVWAAYPARSAGGSSGADRSDALRRALDQLGRRLHELLEFLASPAARAAEAGGLLMTGAAGQGKTHLFCDGGERAIEQGRPAAVLLGQQFAGNRVFTDLAERLGLPPRGATELLGAMAAAGEATGKPFLLLIDALNDSGDPAGWWSDLPHLLGEVSLHAPWIVLGVSVRSSYLDLIDEVDRHDLAMVAHPGFEGYEDDAIERYFGAFGIQRPSIPLLLPEFTNPLFLRLYCEALSETAERAPTAGHAHVSAVFGHYLEAKNRRISRDLKLDPRSNVVPAAVDALARAVGDGDREWLPYTEAQRLVDAHAPHLHEWPHTLFGSLMSEGILTADRAFRVSADGTWERVESVQITFQRLADYRIASSMLDPRTPADLASALRRGRPLHDRVVTARAGIVEALAVLMPERYGIELVDAARWNLTQDRATSWETATLSSIAARSDDAVTARTIELLVELSQRSSHLFAEATRVLIAVAARPDHPLNAEFLHASLLGMSMPDRDASWGITTYLWMHEAGPLDRLIRWAAAGPHPDHPERVVDLATIPLIWLLGSPNRIMRDYITKSLCRLLAYRLPLVERQLRRFRDVDDPYVLERLAVIAHGAVLVGGAADPAAARAVAALVTEIALDPETPPDVVLRDAARGATEWCHRAGLVSDDAYERSKPPYVSEPPGKPRTERQLERAFDRYDADRDDPGYSSIFASVFGLGDFGRYVIESDVRHFSRYRSTRPLPPVRKGRAPKPDFEQLAKLAQDFTDEQRAALSRGDLVELVESLDPVTSMRVHTALAPSRRIVPRSYPADLASRWVFERVVSLGWTPERFAAFDREYRYDIRAGRSGHKPERFGKKYQWIAVRELLARIADNFHMSDEHGRGPERYEGPWLFFGRHIDPTLPPARRVLDDDGVESFASTFQGTSEEEWWMPPGPRYTGDDPPAEAGWAQRTDDIPELEPLVRCHDDAGEEWIVLHAHHDWGEEPAADQHRHERSRRDMWSHIYAWLVRHDDAKLLYDFLRGQSLMGRWMPEGVDVTDDAYLAEMPWAAAANEYPDHWETISPRGEDANDAPDVAVCAAWTQYFWEGNVWDCSIDEGVRAWLPTRDLFGAGGLVWKPGTREWTDEVGRDAALYRETAGRGSSVLLVRADWLGEVLRRQGWSLVVGWLGEKQLLGAGMGGGIVGAWSEINGVALLERGKWTFGPRRVEVQRPLH